MTRTKLFLSNRSQAVRLPKAVAFPDSVSEVVVCVRGNERIIAPVGGTWDEFFDAPGFDLGEREQPPMQVRQAF